MDIYQAVADELNVSRQDVKSCSFPIMYGLLKSKHQNTNNIIDDIRDVVKISLTMGLIKNLKQKEVES